jgi:hypothetical protein
MIIGSLSISMENRLFSFLRPLKFVGIGWNLCDVKKESLGFEVLLPRSVIAFYRRDIQLSSMSNVMWGRKKSIETTS